MKAHVVGSGLASLAAAAYLIRDGGLLANNIHIHEAGEGLGGAMGFLGGPSSGYVLPTGRIFEPEFRCTLQLFSMVPSASDPERSIKDEILEFNARYSFEDKARIIDRDGKIFRSDHYGLSSRDMLDLAKLALTPEAILDDRRISEFFSEDFFQTEFWLLWTTTFGTLPQHSAMELRRYMSRFLHLLPALSSMTGILRTRYNQYEAIVEPMVKWLRQQGVKFHTGSFVRNIAFSPSTDWFTATALEHQRDGAIEIIELGADDVVLVTNGSQTTDLSIGSMTMPPKPCSEGQSWALWKRLAANGAGFGRPDVFFGAQHIPDTKWLTFTVTTTDAMFFDQMKVLTGSEPGRGGFVALKDSGWLITVTIFHQPEFIEQPRDVMVWYGYVLYPDRPGDFVGKPASDCSGSEILEEVLRHLRFEQYLDTIRNASTCIPCVLPYVGSVWLPRKRTDRPSVVPAGSTNFGFIGQFTELPLETMFTMEYSVRSAREAVSALLKLDSHLPPVYQGQHDPSALLKALKVLT